MRTCGEEGKGKCVLSFKMTDSFFFCDYAAPEDEQLVIKPYPKSEEFRMSPCLL